VHEESDLTKTIASCGAASIGWPPWYAIVQNHDSGPVKAAPEAEPAFGRNLETGTVLDLRPFLRNGSL